MGVQVDHLTQHAENIGDRIAVIDDRGNSAPGMSPMLLLMMQLMR